MTNCKYSRLDLVGEFLTQNEGDGGENNQGGAHGVGV